MASSTVSPSLAHEKFHYSVTCHTDDQAVLFCLRALCQFAEQAPMAQIGWGGTKTTAWKKNSHQFTVRFTAPQYRNVFIAEAERLLSGRWSVVSYSDSDPASPQRKH
jgi:hypothetical protein